MSYEFYKVVHFISLFGFFMTAGFSLLAEHEKVQKWLKIGQGIFSFLILVAGMGLLARIGGGFPGWVIAKIVIWLAVSALVPILSKRLPVDKKCGAFIGILVLAALAVYMAVLKPF